MKNLILNFSVIFIWAVQIIGCTDGLSSEYVLHLPQVPQHWVSLLGEPHWRLEWFDPDGIIQSKDLLPGETAIINIPSTWTNPVTAWPYWPDHDLIPQTFRPAGALFPFDVSANNLSLSWEAGVDAVFFRELALANSENVLKIPSNFDWLRFREQFNAETLGEAVVTDPWLVDWRYVAEKTIDSSFDRRRLVPETTESAAIPVSTGYWYGTSPFAEPLLFKEEEIPVFPVRSGINVWISREGILRISGNTWVFNQQFLKFAVLQDSY